MSSMKQKKTSNKAKAESEKRVLATKEKILTIKQEVLQLVELMLEENIEHDWFLKHCMQLCMQDYEDVVQERNIEHLCGYPLCNKYIKQVTKQQYHISKTANKVYDLTERKCFCCTQCYKASNYVKAQLSEVPLYMRKTESIKKIKILPENDNRGSVGEEIVFDYPLTKAEVEKACFDSNETIKEASDSDHFSNMLEKEVENFQAQLSNLTIKENVFEKPFVFSSETPDQEKEALNNDSLSDGEGEPDNDEQKSLFPDYDNEHVSSNKHMPVSETTKKTLQILPLNRTRVSESSLNSISINFVKTVFEDWLTEDTFKYLLGERKVYSIKADILFQTMVNSEISSPEQLSSVKNKYIDLCLKIDKLPEEYLSDGSEGDLSFPSCSGEDILDNLEMLVKDSCVKPVSAKSNPKRRARRKPKIKTKSVSFAPNVKSVSEDNVDVISQEPDSRDSVPEPNFPLIDSVSQNALRRQVLTGNLKTVYFNLLPEIGLTFRDIREAIISTVETFSLTPKNITYKPREWTCIALVLFRILTKTTLDDLENEQDFNFARLCTTSRMPCSISSQEIEDLVSELISPNQLQKCVQH